MTDRLCLLWQWACLLATAAGWGSWIWLGMGRPPLLRRYTWLWCGLAGFCAHALVLQGLVYLDLPLGVTSWPAFGFSLAGMVLGGWLGRRSPGAALRPPWNEVRLFGGVFFTVLIVQAVSVLWVGPGHYFGKGRYDQANYVLTAQFLTDRPFSTDGAANELHPWLLKGIEAKEQRITQSVVHGALAVISSTDSQRAYAAVSVFFVGLAGLAVTAWLRASAAPRWAAALGGIGAGLGPAVTTLQLDGFFSQASTLFVFPALAGLLAGGGAQRPEGRVAASLLLAFLIGAYTEVAVLGLGLVAVMVLTMESPWRQRLCDLGWILAGALLANPGYTARIPAFLREQWMHTRDPRHLAALVPDSGTWQGWGRLFVDFGAGLWTGGLEILAGVAVLALVLLGLTGQPWRRARMLAAVLAVPVAVLSWLLLAPELAKYPFAKLSSGFTPLWVGAAMLGMAAAVRPWRRRAGLPATLVGVAISIGAVSALGQHMQVMRREANLAALDAPGLSRARAEAAAHPERTYLVACDDPLITQWLCYFARASDVYLDRRHLGDRVVPSEAYAFRRLPAADVVLWWLDPLHRGRVESHEPAWALQVRGALEEGLLPGGRYYLAGENIGLQIDRPARQPRLRNAWLDLACSLLPGVSPCELELIDAAGRRQRTTLSGQKVVRFHVELATGRNPYELHIRPVRRKPGEAGLVILQSLSLDPITPTMLANEPRPVGYAP